MTEEQKGELVVRDGRAAAIMKAIPVPRELQELGVVIGADAESGTRVVYLPDELRARVNVVNPTTSYVQADPNWTPGVSIVKLDVARDTYPIPGGKKGLGKQALETLAKAAGVLYTRTTRVPAADLGRDELWAYRATVGFRRSDGTIDEITRERSFSQDAERMEIEDAVRKAEAYDDEGRKIQGSRKFDTEEAVSAEVRKRWIAELRFGRAKTESKAVNRALRAALSIPTSVKTADAGKPWLVVGYNFTPDYDDPEVKRALVAVAMNAQAAIYGGREVSDQLPELEAGDIPADTVTPAEEPAEEHVDEPVDEPREQASGGDGPSTHAAAGGSSTDEPALDDAEPELEEKRSPHAIPEKALDDAGAVIARGEVTVAEVYELAAGGDAKKRSWLEWAIKTLGADPEDPRPGAIRLLGEHRYPELWAELVPEPLDDEDRGAE